MREESEPSTAKFLFRVTSKRTISYPKFQMFSLRTDFLVEIIYLLLNALPRFRDFTRIGRRLLGASQTFSAGTCFTQRAKHHARFGSALEWSSQNLTREILQPDAIEVIVHTRTVFCQHGLVSNFVFRRLLAGRRAVVRDSIWVRPVWYVPKTKRANAKPPKPESIKGVHWIIADKTVQIDSCELLNRIPIDEPLQIRIVSAVEIEQQPGILVILLA